MLQTWLTPGAHGINLAWLIRLRWVLIPAQFVACVLVGQLGRSHVHPGPVAGLVVLGFASNVYLFRRQRAARPAGEPLLGSVLAFDTAVLTAALFWSGGYSNPLSFLYLVEVALATLLLSRRTMWAIVTACFLASGSLLLSHAHHGAKSTHGHDEGGLEHLDMAHTAHAQLHVEGLWLSFAVMVLFITRVRRALEAREAELASERALVARAEKIASLATLAAGAAHELATPLATIATVTKELERRLAALPDRGDDVHDTRVIRSEVDRCRKILDRMVGDASGAADDPVRSVTLGELVDLTVADLEGATRADRAPLELAIAQDLRSRTVSAPALALSQALRSTIKNALEASPADAPVTVAARADAHAVFITVTDRGQGMPQEILARAGEPFFTTREAGRGMGLGLFLTRAVVERLGGSLSLVSSPGAGTTATLRLPTEETR